MWKGKTKIKFEERLRRLKISIRGFWSNFSVNSYRKKPKKSEKKNTLPDLPEEKIDVSEFIEKHRFAIGSILLILIIISGGYLLYRENYFKPSLEKKIENQNLRIESLEAKIEESAKRQNVQTNLNTETVATTTTPQNSGQVAGASSSSIKPAGKVNINTASTSELDTLPGIGAAYAGRIIEYRNSHGGFKSTSELKNIKGIGDKTFEKLADLVTI